MIRSSKKSLEEADPAGFGETVLIMTIKLNIGCSLVRGQYKRGWVNLDPIFHDGVSVLGSGTNLPFRDNSVDLIHSVHVLEHVKRNLYRKLMEEAFRVLKPGGEFWVEVPDFLGMIRTLLEAYQREDHLKVHICTTSIYGKNERNGMAHYWGFTPHLLDAKLREVGFTPTMQPQDSLSTHYKQEPVLVFKAVK